MKIKKLLSLIAAATMAVTALTSAISVSAETVDTGECGSGMTWTLDSEGKLTISGKGEMASPSVTEATSPSDYSNIYTYKKDHMEDIKEVEIEEGVTSIGFCAFYKMPNLETVVLPKTISKFSSWTSSSNAATPKYDYNNYGFAECEKLKNLTLTEGMTAIGAYSFYKCTSLDNVRIPTTITEWGWYSFSECSSLKNITLPEKLTVIGGSVFSKTAVESIVIPSTITNWESSNIRDRDLDLGLSGWSCGYAFAQCNKLSSVTFTDGLKKIANNPFYDCAALKKVVVPASVTDMTYAFSGCIGLQEAYIEDGTVIGLHDGSNGKQESDGFNFSFYYCQNLRKLEIPAGIATTFNNLKWNTGCDMLQEVYLHSKEYGLPTDNESIKVHCYTDSKFYTGNSVCQKINIEDTISKAKDTLKTKLEEAKALNENDYTAESYAALKTAIDNAEKFDENYTGVLPLQWAAGDITSATRKLEKKPQPADYTAVDAALAKIPSDLSIYTDETVNALNDAKEAVVRDLTIDEQERVNGFAKAIEEAIAGLIKKQNSNTGTDNPQNPNQNNNTNKPNQPTSSKDKGKTPTNKVTVPKPAQVKSVKATAKKKKLNVSWKKVSGATGYEVMYATNNKFTKGKKTVKVKKNKVTLKKLKAKKKYFVKVRAYKKVKGNVSYGKWSKVVKKKTK